MNLKLELSNNNHKKCIKQTLLKRRTLTGGQIFKIRDVIIKYNTSVCNVIFLYIPLINQKELKKYYMLKCFG